MLYVSLEFTSMVWYRTCHSHWQSSATISVPGWYEVIYCREHCNGKFFSSITLSPLLVSPACSHHSETAPSPPNYVLHPDTPDPQPALNATLPLYIILFERSYNWHRACQMTLLLRDSLSLSLYSFLLWLQPWSLSTIMLLWHSFLIIIIITLYYITSKINTHPPHPLKNLLIHCYFIIAYCFLLFFMLILCTV